MVGMDKDSSSESYYDSVLGRSAQFVITTILFQGILIFVCQKSWTLISKLILIIPSVSYKFEIWIMSNAQILYILSLDSQTVVEVCVFWKLVVHLKFEINAYIFQSSICRGFCYIRLGICYRWMMSLSEVRSHESSNMTFLFFIYTYTLGGLIVVTRYELGPPCERRIRECHICKIKAKKCYGYL